MQERYVIINNSISQDALGVPSISIYLPYCDKKEITGSFCPNCHNKKLQKDGVGYKLSLDKVKEIIDYKLKNNKKLFGENIAITIIGGEPLAIKNRDFSINLAKYYNKKGIETIVYTWRTIKELKEEKINTKYFNKIICGEFIEEAKEEDYPLASINQYIVDSDLNPIVIKLKEYVKILFYENQGVYPCNEFVNLLIDNGDVRVNERAVYNNITLKKGDEVKVKYVKNSYIKFL